MAEAKKRLIIIGSGPAGDTAALYASRGNLDVTVIGGYEAGGQLMITTDVENYPGFPEGIQGPELMEKFQKQAERFGATFVQRDAVSVDFSSRPFKVTTDEKTHEADAVILATGSSAKWLGLPNEKRLQGHGVSACATCDGFFFKEQKVVVVGGGDTAMEESQFLTRFASQVTVIHRRDKLRASKIMQDRALKNPKIEFIWNTVVTDVLGESKVEGVVLENVATGETRKMEAGGLFLAIGHKPNTDFLKRHVELDEKGYIKVHGRSGTSVEGVFVAGDVHDTIYKQAVTAAGAGCKAAMDVMWWLEGQE